MPLRIGTVIHAPLGEKDEAIAALEQAYQERSWWLCWMKTDPKMDSLRSDSRFNGLVGRIGFRNSSSNYSARNEVLQTPCDTYF